MWIQRELYRLTVQHQIDFKIAIWQPTVSSSAQFGTSFFIPSIIFKSLEDVEIWSWPFQRSAHNVQLLCLSISNPLPAEV